MVHDRDDGPVATMTGRLVAAELWRIKPGRPPPSTKKTLLQPIPSPPPNLR